MGDVCVFVCVCFLRGKGQQNICVHDYGSARVNVVVHKCVSARPVCSGSQQYWVVCDHGGRTNGEANLMTHLGRWMKS